MVEIRSYTLKELAELEKKHPLTVRNSTKYMPIKIYSPTITKRFELGKQKRDYTVRYIRLEDVKKLYKGIIDFTYITD